MYVSSGGTAVDIDCYHGSIYIDDGASAANISGNYAYMYVSSGGAADNIELDNGQIHISAGGSASKVLLSQGGIYLSGGNITQTTLDGISYLYTHMYVYGGSARQTVVNAGTVQLSSSGYAGNTIINAHGSMTIYDSGFADKVLVNPGGTLAIYGGSANVEYNPWPGSIYCTMGTLRQLSPESAVYYGNHLQGVVSKFTATDNFQVSSGFSAFVPAGVSAQNMNVLSGGVMKLESTAWAADIQIHSGGDLVADDSSLISNIFIESGGRLNGFTITSDRTFSEQPDFWSGCSVSDKDRAYLFQHQNAAQLQITSGGILYITADSEITGLNISHGGSLINSGYGVLHSGSVISNNQLLRPLSNEDGDLEIYNFAFTGNCQGAMRNLHCHALLYSAGFTSNTAGNGGAVYNSGGQVTLHKADFISNSAAGNGGAILNYYWYINSGIIASDTRFTANYAGSCGGAVYGDGSFYRVNFADNSAAESGGAVYGGGNFTDTVFSGNSAVMQGGAIYNNSNTNSYNSNRNLFFAANSAASGGAVYNANHQYFNVSGAVFSGNSAVVGGALYNERFGSMMLQDCQLQTPGDTICNGGLLTLRGSNYFAAEVENTGTVICELTAEQAPDITIINDLSMFNGGNYRIKVNNDLPAAAYSIAKNAYDFHNVITVTNANDVILGSLQKHGDRIYVDNYQYTLVRSDGNLILRIAEAGANAGTSHLRFCSGIFAGDLGGINRDMLLQVKDGQISSYLLNAPWSSQVLDPNWEVLDTADFNGDNKTDILRKHASGLVVADLSHGDTTFTPQILNSAAENWEICGCGDFNADGQADILLANPQASSSIGLLGYWSGGREWTLIDGYSPEWQVLAIGDFNGDGCDDMLWRNEFVSADGTTCNAYCTWLTGEQSNWRIVSSARADEWNFLCAGDFNGDATSDIAMINADGAVGIWEIADGTLANWSILSVVDLLSWEFGCTGDFNGDGTDDIVWCNIDTALAGCWQIQNKDLSAWQTLAVLQ